MQVFQKDYDGFESWTDVGRDIDEIWDNPAMKDIPPEWQGTIRITIEYIPEDA